MSNLDKADLTDLIFFVPLIRSADQLVSIHAPSRASLPIRTSSLSPPLSPPLNSHPSSVFCLCFVKLKAKRLSSSTCVLTTVDSNLSYGSNRDQGTSHGVSPASPNPRYGQFGVKYCMTEYTDRRQRNFRNDSNGV
jgi:hypothetical protein